MKKFNLSLVAVLAMSTFAIAGGDIAPVEPVVETPYVEESTGAFYLGLAYGAGKLENQNTVRYLTGGAADVRPASDITYDSLMLQAGYKFNPYVALEGRYWIGAKENLNALEEVDVDTWGLYVKPMYPVTEAFDIYALLGYAKSDATVTSLVASPDRIPSADGFSWGIGGAYNFNDNVAFFIDYTSMYDDTETEAFLASGSIESETTLSTWNFGVTYAF